MQLPRRGQLLAQVGRGVDQEPVRVVHADCERRLSASQLGMFVSGGTTDRTAAIPLRNPAACCGAQDDDAQHDPSPGEATYSDAQNPTRGAMLEAPASGLMK